MKYLSNNLMLFILIFIFISCSSKEREEVLERYSSGAKYIVGIYKGEGSDESFLRREYYQENGKLGRINNLIADSIVSYLDLYPETKTSKGLLEFLQGRWVNVKKVNHNTYDVYEIYSLIFNDNTLERWVNLMICNGDNSMLDITTILVSEVEYLDNLALKENNLRFNSRLFPHSWEQIVRRYNFDKHDFIFSLFTEVGYGGAMVENNSIVDKWIFLNRIAIGNRSIGEDIYLYHHRYEEYNEEVAHYIFDKRIPTIGSIIMEKRSIPGTCTSVKNFAL